MAGSLPAAWAQDELFVANVFGNSVTVYSRTASGNIAPIRTLSGGATGLSGPGSPAVTTSTTPPPPTAAIPTLSEWAQIGMMGLLVVGGLLALRRRAA